MLSSCCLTLEITRLRASKTTFDTNAPPQAQPVSIKRRLAIRVQQALPRRGISPPEKLAGMPPSGVSYIQAYAKNKTEQFTDGDEFTSSASTCNMVPALG